MRLNFLAFTLTTALSTFVPVVASAQSVDINTIQDRLVEAETKVMTLKAERDEYRSLLHTERKRLKDMANMQDNIADSDQRTNNMVNTIRKLEAEKVDLLRQLDYAKHGPEEAANLASKDTVRIAEMQERLNQIGRERQKLSSDVLALEREKSNLMKQLQQAENDIVLLQKQKTSVMPVNDLDGKKDARIRSLEQEIAILRNQNRFVADGVTADQLAAVKTLEAEIASLEAQNQMLRDDVRSMQKRQISSVNVDAEQQLAALENRYSNRFKVMEGENIRLTRALETEKSKQPKVIEKIIEVEKIVEVERQDPSQGAMASSVPVQAQVNPSYMANVRTAGNMTQPNARSVPLTTRIQTPKTVMTQTQQDARVKEVEAVDKPKTGIVWQPVPSEPSVIETTDLYNDNAEVVVNATDQFKSVPVHKGEAGRVNPNTVRRSLRSKIVMQDPALPEDNYTQTGPIQMSNMNVMDQSVPMALVNTSASQQSASTPMVELSGDKVKRLVMNSNIPLVSGIERVNKVSGPDFAAFRWDTGNVYGSAEQAKLSSSGAFSNSVQAYINKVKSRCNGSFDQTNAPVNVMSGITATAVDIACVSDTQGAATVSALFFEENGMFYAISHEADLNTFETAMDLRDRIADNLAN